MSICATVAGCKSLIWDAHNWNTDICNRFVICCIVTAGFRKWQLSTCKCCLILCHLCQQWSKLRAIVSLGPQDHKRGTQLARTTTERPYGQNGVQTNKLSGTSRLWCHIAILDQHYCSQNFIMKLSSNSRQTCSFRRQQNGACFPPPGCSHFGPGYFWT